MTATRVARWNVALVAAFSLILLGLVLGAPGLVVLAVVPLGFVLVGQVSTAPDPDLRVERDLDSDRVRPGESVTVTLSVTNEGDAVVPDVRLVDEPPEGVPVADGSPGFATALRPGETVRHRYELAPPRGGFSFGSARLRLRSIPGTERRTLEREPEGAASFSCETLLDSFPFRERTIQYVGRTPTDDGGSGIEFFSTREYRRGDPINRVDWHRLARTGELATVEYRTERAVTTVFVIDDRGGIHRASIGGGPDSYDLCLYAAARGVVASLEEGNRTGLTTLSDDVRIEPGVGSGVRRRVEAELGFGPGLEPNAERSGRDRAAEAGRDGGPSGDERTSADGSVGRTVSTGRPRTDGGGLAALLERRLPARAQVVLCTPLSDERAVDLVRTLRARNRAVTVVSPDVTTGAAAGEASAGVRVARLERANRIDELRGLGAIVVDWDLDDPLSVDLVRALRYGGGSP